MGNPADNANDEADMAGQRFIPKNVSFIPSPFSKSKVKTRKPLEIAVWESPVYPGKYKASHMLPVSVDSLKGGLGGLIVSEGGTEEEAVNNVFIRLQLRLYKFRQEGKYSTSVQRAYLESILDMPSDYNPNA